MTTVDTKKLRELAEAALAGRDPEDWDKHLNALVSLEEAATPDVVIALLDEIERLRGDTEWEYAVRNLSTGEVFDPVNGKWWRTTDNEEPVRRRVAGPWEPVEGETGE